jgi:hypothetical protein
MRIAIQCESLGYRCGIYTYASRVNRYLNQLEDVKSSMFINKFTDGIPDIINIQYEPGLLNINKLNKLLQQFKQPVVVTAHHMLNLNQVYPLIDGTIIHDEGQILNDKPWDYRVIPHPALVYPKKDKKALRKKYGLPEDKKIIGTMGFICGTGKILPVTVHEILKNIKDDEFLYLITSFWKGGDMGRLKQIMNVVKSLNKENQFRIDTDFISDEEILNEKMQSCDILYAWNNITQYNPGSQSGSAADMYGSRVKLVVKNCPHYSFIGKQDKVVVGRQEPNEFVEDVLNTLRNSDLNDVQDPSWLSWESKIKDYKEYMTELL